MREIVISGVVASTIAAKFIFLTLFRGTPRLTSRSARTWAVWIGICAAIWTVGWLIAEVIPVRLNFPRVMDCGADADLPACSSSLTCSP